MAAAAAVAAVLAGCGSTTGGTSADAVRTASNAAQQPSAAPTTEALAPTTGASAAASVAPPGASALPGVPAVAGATDLTKEPVLSPGTGTPSAGLVTRDLVVGTGTPAVATDTVDVKYVGAAYNGRVFDASWGKPQSQPGLAANVASFPLDGVVPGFAEGIVGMKPGGRREIVIPAALGYGPEGGNPAIDISATDTIVFVVDYVGAAS